MATPVANVNSITDTFEQWLSKTNDMCVLFSNNALTATATAAGHSVAGNSQLVGQFSAVAIASNTLFGGNLTNHSDISLGSNLKSTAGILIVGANVAVFEQLRGSNSVGGSANLLITTNTFVNAAILSVDHDFTATMNAAANVVVATSALRGGNNTASASLTISSDVKFAANVTNTFTVTANVVVVTSNVSVNATAFGLVGNSVVIQSVAGGYINVNSANLVLTVNTATLSVNTITGSVLNVSLTGTNLNVAGTTAVLTYTTANVAGGKLNVTSNTQFYGDVQGNVNFTGTKASLNGALVELSSFCDIQTASNTNIGATGSDKLIFVVNNAIYSSAKLTVQTKNSSQTQISEVILSANGTESHLTVYGTVSTPPAANLAALFTNTSGTDTRIYVTPSYSNMSVKLVAHLLK